MQLQYKSQFFRWFPILCLVIILVGIAGCGGSNGIDIRSSTEAISKVFASFGKWFSTTIPGVVIEGVVDSLNRTLAAFLGANINDPALAGIIVPDYPGSLTGTSTVDVGVKFSKDGIPYDCLIPHPRMLRDTPLTSRWQVDPSYQQMLYDFCKNVALGRIE